MRAVAKRVFAFRSLPLFVLWAVVAVAALPSLAAKPAQSPGGPFKGSADEQAISAVPVDEDTVFVTTVGEGQATHLGHFTFVSPHLSGLSDFSIDGTQLFTAANGDELRATLLGNLAPVVDATGHVYLVGDVTGTITGGTGRFANATGTFTLHIEFDTETFHSISTIDGTIHFAGK
jgi:hypothetical protein